jgi:APA family basic amino acid/polyamine antiporter
MPEKSIVKTESASQTATFIRSLGLFSTITLIVGAVIGSGVFMKPALMALQLGSPLLLLGVWVLAGIITLFGALTNAEIAGMITETGGQYVYFQRMYGELVAFLYGWSVFAVTFTGGLASIAYVFAEYAQYFVSLPRFSTEVERSFVVILPYIGSITPLANMGVKALTILVIVVLTVVNYVSVRAGGTVQNVFTVMKVLAIGALVGAVFVAPSGNIAHFTHNAPSGIPTGFALLAAIAMATSGAFWAYDGWNNITYIAGEVKEPQRTIPRALLLGMVTVIGVYVLINVAYIYILPIERIAASPLVASEAATVALGSIGGAFIAIAVMISTFGTTNGNILAGARLYYAMAREKMFFRSVGVINPRTQTPARALLVQAVWSSVLVLSGSFDMLTDMLIFVSWLFYALGAAGVFVLRRKMPDTPRPYKVWGYPFVPAVFVIFACVFLVVTVVNDISAYRSGASPVVNSALGLVLTATGLPLYWYFRRRNKM